MVPKMGHFYRKEITGRKESRKKSVQGERMAPWQLSHDTWKVPASHAGWPRARRCTATHTNVMCLE